MNSGVGHQVSLELSQVNVQSSVESQRGGDGRYDLTDQSVQVAIRWALNIQVPAADVINSLVVNHEGTVRVFKGGVGGEDGIVGFNNSCSNLRSRIHREFKLGLLTIINRQSFHEKRSKTRSSATTEGMEQKETLQTCAHISKLPNSVQNKINNLLTNSIMSSGIIVSGILLAIDQLFRMEKLAVSSTSCLVNHSWLQINKDSSGHMLASSSLGEKGGEGIISKGLVRGHVAVRLDSMLKAVQLPTGITDLNTGLANVD